MKPLLLILSLGTLLTYECCENVQIKMAKLILEADIWKDLYYRSVYVNINSKINLDLLFSPTFEINEKNVDIVLLQIYNVLQCQCTRSMLELLYPIRKFIQTQWPVAPQLSYLDDKEKIPFLKNLNENINLTIFILFKIIDLFPILKHAEPFFLKTLLMIHLYFDKLLFKGHVDATFDTLDEFKIQGILGYKKRKIGFADSITTIEDTDYDKDVTDHTYYIMDQNDLEFLTNVALIHNTIDQIINVIERFTLQTCNDAKLYNINDDDDIKNIFVVDHMKNLTNLDNNQINIFYPNMGGKEFNLKEVLLTDVFLPDIDELNFFRSIRYITDANITVYSNDGQPQKLSLKYDIFSKTKKTYKIEVIYEYLKLVYDVQLKILFHKINELICKIENAKKSNESYEEHSNLYFKSLKQLVLINAPIDLIKDFKALWKCTISEIDYAKKIVKDRLSNLSHVELPTPFEFDDIKLDEIITLIKSQYFKQFLWVFNLLHREAEKKSNYVYDVSLKFTPYSEDPKVIFICESLQNIYINFFRFEDLIQSSIMTKVNEDKQKSFKKLLKLHTNFGRHLSQVMRLLSNRKYLSYGDDFLKILIALTVQLRNTEFNIGINNEPCNDSMCIDETVDDKLYRIMRIKFLIINLLDNYQMCNCGHVNRRDLYYLYYRNVNVFLKHRIKDSIMYIINIPIAMIKKNNKVLELTDELEIKLSLNKQEQCPKDDNSMDICQPTTKIPSDYYDLKLLSKIKFLQDQLILLSVPKFISFNWYGQIISFKSLDVSKGIISLYQLVEYQRLLFKWIISSFYTVWIVLFEHFVIKPKKSHNVIMSEFKDVSVSDKLYRYLNEMLSIKFDDPFEKDIIRTISVIYNTYDSVKTHKTLSSFNVLKIFMVEQMESFYVVDLDTSMEGLKKMIQSRRITLDVNFDVILTQCISNFKMYINTLKKHLIFLK